MNLISPITQFFPRPVRATFFFGCVLVFLWLNAAAQAAEPPHAITPSNAAATSSNTNSKAQTNATPTSTTNTATASTNLSKAGATNSASALDDTHKLAIGDRLSFRIVEDEGDSKQLYVTDSGDVEVPYIGRVAAENKTCRQLGAEIKTALEKDYYYQATVIIAVDVMTKSHGRVYLVGAVRTPGPVELPSDETLTLSKAILRAGAFTDYADRRHVKVTRKGATDKDDKKTFIVDVGKIFDKGKIETDLPLETGDLIFVPDRLIRF
jgi:protein involved in polysaccharide export with SLBB domain